MPRSTTPRETAPFEHVRWIGGGPGAGKTTLARRLAERYGWRLLSTDASMGEHGRQSDARSAPFLHQFLAMGMDERWLDRSPSTMAATFHWFRGEAFELILEDLRGLPTDRVIVVEGLRLLPRLVRPLLTDPRHAAWLLPTPAFRRAALDARGESFVSMTSDPAQAARNLAERDELFVASLREETARLGLSAIEVDGAVTTDDLVRELGRRLGESSSGGNVVPRT